MPNYPYPLNVAAFMKIPMNKRREWSNPTADFMERLELVEKLMCGYPDLKEYYDLKFKQELPTEEVMQQLMVNKDYISDVRFYLDIFFDHFKYILSDGYPTEDVLRMLVKLNVVPFPLLNPSDQRYVLDMPAYEYFWIRGGFVKFQFKDLTVGELADRYRENRYGGKVKRSLDELFEGKGMKFK